MQNITYCMSKYCDCKNTCKRHCNNNDLRGKIYSASDFTNKDETKCEFFISNESDSKHYSNKLQCEYCGEYLTGIAKVGDLGLKYIHCNSCGNDSYNVELGEIMLTKDNVNYPQHYYSYANGADVSNDKINQWVKECITDLELDPDSHYCFVGSGNTIVVVFNRDDEYEVKVCKGYSETSVKK